MKVRACHLYQLSKADHQSGCGHDGDNHHQNLAQLLEEIKVDARFPSLFLLGRLCLSHRGLCRCFLNLFFLCSDGENRSLSSLHLSLAVLQSLSVHPSAHQNRCDGVDLLLGQGGQIHLGDQIPCLHLVACLYEDLKAFALKPYGLQAHMDQKLQPILRAEPVGMKRLCHGGHFSVHRAGDPSVCGDHSDAVADDLLRKHRIRNLVKWHSLACCRRQNADLHQVVFLTTHIISLLFLCKLYANPLQLIYIFCI